MKLVTENVCRDFLRGYLTDRAEAFDLMKKSVGDRGFSAKQLDDFARPWIDILAKLKKTAQAQGVSSQEFEKIRKELIVELKL